MFVLKCTFTHVMRMGFLGLTLFCLLALSTPAVSGTSEEKLKVVATFSILADMVQQLGGEHVKVRTLVDWDEDAHVFQPSPDDVKYVAGADLLVINGLGFEGWLARMLTAAEFKGLAIEATRGVDLIKQGGGVHKGFAVYRNSGASVYDPHAWHSLKAARFYVENISTALITLDPAHEQEYFKRKMAYLQQLETLDRSITDSLRRIPDNKKRLVVPHNAFAYLARDYHLTIHSLQGMSTDSEASAADMVQLVRLIKSLDIKAIFTETISDQRLIRVIESETNARIEGALISGALSRELAPSYLAMMKYNTDLIVSALSR